MADSKKPYGGITVEPNASGKSRKLEVAVSDGQKRAYIKVKQK